MDRLDTRILILASGPNRTWPIDDDRCRQLLPIQGEPLVLRTRRLCEELGYRATIVTDNPIIQAVAQRYFAPGPNFWIFETMQNTRELWAERTIFLPGDVLYNKETLQKIFDSEEMCLWEGAFGVLAVVFLADDENWENIPNWLNEARSRAARKGTGELQILHDSITKIHHDWRKDLYDFDTPESYEKCLVNFPWIGERRKEDPQTVLILAAGKLSMWKGDCCRHLVKIAGEPLLVRTLRELEERGYDATVVTDNPEITEAIPGCFKPQVAEVIWRTMLSTQGLWEGRVLVMLGDVFYEDDMYDLMLSYDGQTPVCFDSFACAWDEKDYGDVVEILEAMGKGKKRAFNHLWREGHVLKVPREGHIDFDIVPYYEQFLENNPWARGEAE